MAQIIALRQKPVTKGNASADPYQCYGAARIQQLVDKFTTEFDRLQAEHKRKTDLLLSSMVKELGAQCPPTVHRSDELIESLCQPASWREITLTLFNEHTLEIRTGDGGRNFGCEDLQLCGRRNGKPDGRWLMLLRLAGGNGVLSRPGCSFKHKDDGGWSNWKKDIQALRAWLRVRFQIAADPLPFSDGAYRAQFGIQVRESYREELHNTKKRH
jgi:hypothetical protein